MSAIPPLGGLPIPSTIGMQPAFVPATNPTLPASSLHSATVPLSSQQSQKLSYEQLLASYQQVCSERDAFASQVEKLKERSLALSIDTAANPAASASLSVHPTSPTPRSHHLAVFSPTSPSPRTTSASASTATSPSASNSSAANSANSNNNNPLQTLRDKHSLIQSTIHTIQHKTARILHDQERELIRAFRLRLAALTSELDAERARSASGSAEWVGRCGRLSEEMEWLRGLVEEVGGENRGLGKEVRRMRKAMKVQEEDRDFLIKQLVDAKKRNARLQAALEKGGAGDIGGLNGSTHLMMLGATGQDAVGTTKEWGEAEEQKTAMH